MADTVDDRSAVSTEPQDIFVELFSQVFGLEKVQLLSPEHAVKDIYGSSRYVDFALRTPEYSVAFEIDGLTWHHPSAVTIDKFEDDLLRQNSLVHQGWKVFRWTDRNLIQHPERVKEELALFLESVPGLLAFDDFLPKQKGEAVELRPHQEDALRSLEDLRRDSKTIALLTHATGTGKTHVAIADARRVGQRTLCLAHTKDLVKQTARRFRELWPEASTGIFMGPQKEGDAHNVVASVQSVTRNLAEFPSDAFGYLIIDEAHHSASKSYQKVLSHFSPRFILGLTATPERDDGISLLDMFRESAHRLSLEEAIKLGELVPIRCIRVLTNVDLGRVRFNSIRYNPKDIEEAILIPSRDQLIVDTYLSHVRGKRGVAFCVNVRHGEDLARLFVQHGVKARSVSGRMPSKERDDVLAAFAGGDLELLCACDILNEGWDCPEVQVLLMARPTLSKVIYLQQLGRGTRKAEGKDGLYVFDFVDNARRYSVPLSLHRVLGKRRYRPGALVAAPQEVLSEEEQRLAEGHTPEAILQIGLWAKDYQEVDLFNWQERLSDVISAGELENELATSEGLIRRAIERGEIEADHVVQIGDRTYHYFEKGRAEQVRQALGLPKVDASTIKSLFMADVEAMPMSASYKPVLLLALLKAADGKGRIPVKDAVTAFRAFYESRKEQALPVERPGNRMSQVEELDDQAVQAVMFSMPFEKFERRKYLKYDRDLAWVRFSPPLWQKLGEDDRRKIEEICEQKLKAYYDRL